MMMMMMNQPAIQPHQPLWVSVVSRKAEERTGDPLDAQAPLASVTTTIQIFDFDSTAVRKPFDSIRRSYDSLLSYAAECSLRSRMIESELNSNKRIRSCLDDGLMEIGATLRAEV